MNHRGDVVSNDTARKETAMRYVRLGKTELEVSAIAFGTWAFGGDWGSFDAHESGAAIHHTPSRSSTRPRPTASACPSVSWPTRSGSGHAETKSSLPPRVG